jgi:hypothetical protein
LSVEVEGDPDAVTVRADADESRYGLDVLVFNRNKVPEIAVNGDVGCVMVEAVGS